MTSSRLIRALTLACAAAVPSLAGADAARVEVVFVDPQKFADVRDGYTQTDAARDFYLAELKRYLEREAARRLGDGEALTVRITDVQLAGTYEARRPEITNVRIVRGVNPARIDLGFRLERADGTVAAEGARQLRSTGYPVGIGIDPSDPLLYEKVLLDDWLTATFPPRR